MIDLFLAILLVGADSIPSQEKPVVSVTVPSEFLKEELPDRKLLKDMKPEDQGWTSIINIDMSKDSKAFVRFTDYTDWDDFFVYDSRHDASRILGNLATLIFIYRAEKGFYVLIPESDYRQDPKSYRWKRDEEHSSHERWKRHGKVLKFQTFTEFRIVKEVGITK